MRVIDLRRKQFQLMVNSIFDGIYNALDLIFLIKSRQYANPVQQMEAVIANFQKNLKSPPRRPCPTLFPIF